MSYSMSNYRLVLTTDFSALEVRDASTQNLEASYDLDEACRVSCNNGNYVIETEEVSASGLFAVEFDPSNNDQASFPANLARMACVTDLRIECKVKNYDYDLDECPVILLYQSGALKVHSPCSGSCTAPSNGCCTITEDGHPNC